jgi:hypothetical protein
MLERVFKLVKLNYRSRPWGSPCGRDFFCGREPLILAASCAICRGGVRGCPFAVWYSELLGEGSRRCDSSLLFFLIIIQLNEGLTPCRRTRWIGGSLLGKRLQ